MKRFSIIGLLLLWAILAQGQTLTIRDLHSRLPLEGVVLISEVPPVYAVTNAHGQAGISAFRGAETIQVRSLGYVTLELSYRQMQDSGFVLHLVPSALDLDQVVVSATRWSQASRNVPSRILSISPREVALQNPQTAADMLGITGKVFIQKSQQGGGSPMIRGFAANRLLYTVDGVRMNTAIFRGGNVQNVINLDPFAIEKTETLFGPSSVIYGSDAIGGVMSFQTLTPQLSLDDQPLISGKAITRYSSANQERTGHLNFNIGWKRWALVTSFSSWDYDHLRQGSHGPQEYLKKVYAQRQDSLDVVITQDDPLLQIPSAYAQVNLMQKVRYSPDAHWDLQYGFHYSTTSSYGRYDRHNRYRNGTLRYAEWDYGPQRWMMHHFSLAHQGKSIWYDRLSLRLAKQSFEESRIDRSFNSPERNTQKEEVEAWSVNLDLSRQAGSRNTLFYGMEYVYNTVASHGLLSDIVQGTAQAGPSRYPSSEWRSLAAYLSHELRLSTHLTLQGGLRYNHYSLDADFNNNAPYYLFPFTSATLSKGAITGSLGAVYRPSGAWAFRANLGTAFRSPNVDDVGKVFDSEPGTVTVPNPGLKAEYAWNADLGVVRVLGDAVKLDFTGYYTVLQDALVRRDYLLNGQDSIPYFGEM
ncbi:MAG TPA: TonB-dependent receptor, partial [Bacteroidales bacterium]|nr:TonB-dependent receptor [Bacteroidales bacterium]